MKGAAVAHVALHPDPAAHHLHQSRGDGQAQPGAAELARRGAVRLRESLEDELLLFRRRCRCRCRVTTKCSWSSSGVLESTAILSPTSPRSVNLMALPTRLTRIWRRRLGSPTSRVRHVRADVAGQLQALLRGRARPASSCVSRHAVAQVELDRIPARACPPRSWRSRGCR